MDDPRSPSDTYLACLTKVDQVPDTSVWFLLFDMIPSELALLAFSHKTSQVNKTSQAKWPQLPTILFSVVGAADSIVRSVLDPQKEGPIEGSWYSLHLSPNGDPSVDLTGQLYPPGDEFAAQPSKDWSPRYGIWHIDAFKLFLIPVVSGPHVILGPPPPNAAIYCARKPADQLPNGATKRVIDSVSGLPIGGKRTYARVKRRRLDPPPVVQPAGFGAIGVMDIGQGGFNLMFDRTLEPIVYYDAGYPLGFFRSSMPQTMRRDLVTFTGPIYQNTTNTLEVILSHWDWDHWRAGVMPPFGGHTLATLPWTFPEQPMSPTALNFVNHTLVLTNVVAGGAPPLVVAGIGANAYRYTIFKYVPPAGVFGGMLINNSGLAMRVSVDLAAGVASQVLLTGDGNFEYLPLAARAGLTGIGAVHHGSIAHGASTNLPAAPLAGTGYVVYSYGISSVTGNHSYGFPVAGAVVNYRAGNWIVPTEMSTAEGTNLNTVFHPPAPQGNIRMGNQGALPAAYTGTSFAGIGHALP